ncbi:2813_t:CDS:2, partial [Ambispora gerdemannii]
DTAPRFYCENKHDHSAGTQNSPSVDETIKVGKILSLMKEQKKRRKKMNNTNSVWRHEEVVAATLQLVRTLRHQFNDAFNLTIDQLVLAENDQIQRINFNTISPLNTNFGYMFLAMGVVETSVM